MAAHTGKPLAGEIFGALINLSGRRRFTSQRLVLYAVLAAQGQEDAIGIAREALELFRGAHTALLSDKDGLPGVFCAELQEAYFGKQQGDRQIVHFMELAERTLGAMEQASAQAEALLAELVRITTPTLTVLHQITAIYEEQSKLHATLMKKQLRGVITDIETIAKQARMVAFNARIVAARAGHAGREFAVVAGVLSNITSEIDDMVSSALSTSV
ncbi:methyl-accepting chemotaxis protein [Massilia endophytica]|uniref:methyl-accepting chemotaxis protein n=1 Tax=Massilia endophytica TaxID=2899220 RepID=UPI001E46F3E3|nr:methyl-accepting chemotaxis protein [Massilia endophytica]UGQ45865.1 methyl-accepting chemotaxis protein [Massilia endophytica]